MIATRAFHRRILVACLVVFVAACGGDDNGAKDDKPPGHKPTSKPVDSGAADADVADGAASGAPKFGAIFKEVITGGGGCNAGPLCHGGSAGMLRMNEQTAAYEALVDVPAKGMNLADTTGANCVDTELVRVVPGDPEHSLLMQKIDPPKGGVPCGSIMPPIGMLTSAQIEQVRTWIENGAKDD